jgi:signal transduction histidine kinase
MRLRTQFIITMCLFGIILFVMAASEIITSQQVEKADEQEKIASSIAQGTNELSYLANDYLIYRESQQFKRWQSRFASFSSQVASLRTDRPDQQALVAIIRTNQKRLKEVFDSVASAPAGPSRNQRKAFDTAFLQVSWSRMAVQSQGLVSDASRLSQLLHRQMDQLIETKTMLTYVMVGLFGVFLLASYMLTYQRILKSIGTLQAGTAVIGSGNLDFIIEEKKNDEIGDLSRAFNRMTTDLKVVIASKTDLEREITERKRVEEALRSAHERAVWLARFPEENPNPVLRVSADGTMLYCNPTSVKIHEWACEIGKRLQGPLLLLAEKAMTNTKEVTQGIELGGRFYSVSVTPFPEEGYVNIYGRDITARKRAEEALQQRTLELQQLTETLEQQVEERTLELARTNEALRYLSSRLLSAQEDERKRVAGEIHDTLGACLSAIKFKVEKAMQEVGKNPNAVTESLDTIIPMIQEGVEECRRIQMDLRPSMLDDLGLLPTLSWFCRRFQTIYTGIKVELEKTLEEHEVPDSLKVVTFRVTQEAMNNIAKHSKGDLVRLSLRKIEGRMELVVEDNGHGFDPEKVLGSEKTRRGLGLTSMRERTELSGGSFSIKSSNERGTIIRASWPVHENG